MFNSPRLHPPNLQRPLSTQSHRMVPKHWGTPWNTTIPGGFEFCFTTCKPSFSHHFPMKTTTFSPAFRHPGCPCSILQGGPGGMASPDWSPRRQRPDGEAELKKKWLSEEKKNNFYGIWMGFLWDLKWDLNGILNGIFMGFEWDLSHWMLDLKSN